MVATWWRNGKAQANRDQKLKDNQDMILDKLNDERTGLGALNEKIHAMQNTCTGARTGFDGRITVVEREIKEVKKK
jgi:hypothetical protein